MVNDQHPIVEQTEVPDRAPLKALGEGVDQAFSLVVGSIYLLDLSGYWDARTYDTFLQLSVDMVNQRAYQVVVDCSNLVDIEAAALEGLIKLLQLAIARGGELVLVDVPVTFKTRLDGIGMLDCLLTFPSLKTAVDYLSSYRWF